MMLVLGDGEHLFAGTYMGDVKMFNLKDSEEETYHTMYP